MKRNKSILDFQKRLIRSAAKSPRMESLNLMSIIYSNLREFIEVRVPLDDNPDELMDNYLEVLELFDSALQKKFPQLYLDNDISRYEYVWDYTLHAPYCQYMVNGELVELRLETEPASILKIIQELQKDIQKDPKLCGVMVPVEDSFHFVSTVMLYVIARRIYKNFTQAGPHTYVEGSALHVAAPASPVEDEEYAKEMIQSWLELKQEDISNWVTIDVRDDPNDVVENDDLASIFSIDESDKSCNIHMIHVRNTLMINFDWIAKSIIKFYANLNKAKEIVYQPHQDYTAIRNLCIDNRNMTMLRTPMVAENITNKLQEVMFSKYPLASHPCIQEAWMTIYRTGKLDSDDPNLKYLLENSRKLKDRAHIFIECRAREDESNNLAIYQRLKELGADVHICSTSKVLFSKKVHAKVWLFRIREDRVDDFVALYSTGNFLRVAQEGFSDTILIQKYSSVCPEVTTIIKLFEGLRGIKDYDNDVRSSFIWMPNLIRERLSLEIANQIFKSNMMTLQPKDVATVDTNANRPFIWFKCNHIIDESLIQRLFEAANLNIEVNVIVRTTCTISTRNNAKNLHVKSIMGQYLEHDRWFIFGEYRDGVPVFNKVFISSADLMPRNLDSRVEFLKEVNVKEIADKIGDLFSTMFTLPTSPEDGYFNYTI